MNVIWDKVQRPQLLTSALTDTADIEGGGATPSPTEDAPSFSSNSLRLFVLVIAAAAATAALIVAVGRHIADAVPRSNVRILEVQTKKIATSRSAERTPAPLVVEFNAGMLQVSAIALGHPHLAVINGRTVTEGDTVVVHAPTHAVAISLRVTAIADGYVDLFDGTQTVRTHFSPSSPPSPKL